MSQAASYSPSRVAGSPLHRFVTGAGVRAAILVIAYVSAIEIKLSVRLIADLTGEADNRRNLPIKTSPSPNLAVRYDCVVELRHSVRVAKLIIGPESGLCERGSRIQRYIPAEFVL